MKNLLAIAFVLLFGSLSSFSQNSSNNLGTSDPDAKKVLDAVTAKFKSYSAVKATFKLQIENSAGKVQGTKSGTVYMKGNQYKLELNDQQIFCNGKNIWTYDKSSNEVQLTKFDASGNSFTPQKIFANFYDKDFLYKLNGEKKEAGKTLHEIELTPTDKSKAFFKILAYVDKATKNIVSTKVFEKNGNKYTYSVTAFTPNTKITDDTFAFDTKKFPGVEVIDLQ